MPYTIPVHSAVSSLSDPLRREDGDLLVYNLSLSYQERLEQHQAALEMMLTLKEAGIRYHAKSQQPAQTPPRK